MNIEHMIQVSNDLKMI